MINLFQIWTDPHTDENISATADSKGKCLLKFDLKGTPLAISVTQDSICSVLLGAKTHFASHDGLCELRLSGDEIEVHVRPCHGQERVILIKANRLQTAATQIFPPKPKEKFGWL